MLDPAGWRAAEDMVAAVTNGPAAGIATTSAAGQEGEGMKGSGSKQGGSRF